MQSICHYMEAPIKPTFAHDTEMSRLTAEESGPGLAGLEDHTQKNNQAFTKYFYHGYNHISYSSMTWAMQ